MEQKKKTQPTTIAQVFQQNRAQRLNLKNAQSQFVMCSSFNVFGKKQQGTVNSAGQSKEALNAAIV